MSFFGTKQVIKKRVETITKEMIKNKNCRVCVLPDSVKVIEDETFLGCNNLKELIFIDKDGNRVNHKLERIGGSAFQNTSIEEFVYSYHLVEVGRYAFSHTPLSRFEYYDETGEESRLAEIGPGAFYKTHLKDIVLFPDTTLDDIETTWDSILCKDNGGNIVARNYAFKYHYLEEELKNSNLKEISLLGENALAILRIMNQCNSLRKVHMDIENMEYVLRYLPNLYDNRAYEFVLYGEINELKINNIHVSVQITFDKKTKVRIIDGSVLEKIDNTELILPEGVEEIECLQTTAKLKKLELPATIKKIKYSSRFCSLEIVVIYKNLPRESCENLFASLQDGATVIIKGNHFDEMDKMFFQNINQNRNKSELNLEFVEDESLETEESLYQNVVDELNQELRNWISLLPDDFQQKVIEKYNQILEEYDHNRLQEEQNIISNNLSFGFVDAYTKLRTELLNLRAEIVMNQKAILRLNEIKKYKELVLSLENVKKPMELKGEDTKSLEAIIRKISCTVNGELMYASEREILVQKMITFLNDTEEVYHTELSNLFNAKKATFPTNPMEILKGHLEQLRLELENLIFQEALKLRNAFHHDSDSLDIKSLIDNIQTMNYVMKKPSFKGEAYSKWERSIVDLYYMSLNKMISNYMKQWKILEEDMQVLKKQLTCDLLSFVEEAIIIYNDYNYHMSKMKEVKDSYKFFCDEKNRKNIHPTLSTGLIAEIIKIDVDFSSLQEPYSLEEKIYNEVTEIEKKLSSTCNREDINQIMQQYYEGLTNIWAQVNAIHCYQKSKILLKKIGE